MKKIYILAACIGILLLALVIAPVYSWLHKGESTPVPEVQNPEMSENQKGYQWAEENDIRDTKQCKHESKDFEQGCINYIQDHVDDALQDSDSSDE